MLETQLAIATLDVHRLVVCQLHRFPVVEVLFPLHGSSTLDCIHLGCILLLVFPPLRCSLVSLLLSALSVHHFLVHLLLNLLLELLLSFLEGLLSLHGLLHRLLGLKSIVYFLF